MHAPADTPTPRDAQTARRHLYARACMGQRLGTETLRLICRALDHPERVVPSVIVAGTNGKGSTASLLHAALRQAGWRCGLLTSPHLLRFNERIRVGDAALTDADFAHLYARLVQTEQTHGVQLTFFEALTVLAFLAFAAARLEWSILEVGLGGRLDAVNVSDARLALFTPIALDHQAQLGPTIAHIAAEKAWVMRGGARAISAPQPPMAANQLRQHAKRVGCKLDEAAARPAFLHQALQSQPPYQAENFALAWAAAAQLGVDGRSFARAAQHFVWPGRYHTLQDEPLCIVDGAHNEAGCQALAQALQTDPRLAGRRLALVFTAVADKDATGMLRALSPLHASLHVCPVRVTRSRSHGALAALVPQGTAYHDTPAALQGARAAAGDAGAVVVCGSLYLVAEALSHVRQMACDPPIVG